MGRDCKATKKKDGAPLNPHDPSRVRQKPVGRAGAGNLEAPSLEDDGSSNHEIPVISICAVDCLTGARYFKASYDDQSDVEDAMKPDDFQPPAFEIS